MYYFNGTSPSDSLLGGYYIQYEAFSFATVPKSGHFVPAGYYDASLSYLDDLVNNGKLDCHDSVTNCSVAPLQCAAMNNCSGPDRGVCT